MARQSVSHTALGAVIRRLIEQYQPAEVRLFNDPVVQELVSAPVRLMMQFASLRKFTFKQTETAGRVIYGMQTCRTRYIDDAIQATLAVRTPSRADPRAGRTAGELPASPGAGRHRVGAARTVAGGIGLEPSSIRAYLQLFDVALVEDAGTAEYQERFLKPLGRDLAVFEGERIVQSVVSPH